MEADGPHRELYLVPGEQGRAADLAAVATIYRRAIECRVGLALREDKKLVDKITKGVRMHP
jgi:hypothetical protein